MIIKCLLKSISETILPIIIVWAILLLSACSTTHYINDFCIVYDKPIKNVIVPDKEMYEYIAELNTKYETCPKAK